MTIHEDYDSYLSWHSKNVHNYPPMPFVRFAQLASLSEFYKIKGLSTDEEDKQTTLMRESEQRKRVLNGGD